MVNDVVSDVSSQSPRRLQLTRLALASLMAFGAIGGFASAVSAQSAEDDAAITASVGSALSVTVTDVAFGTIVPNGGLETSGVYAQNLDIVVDSTVAWTADAAIAANVDNDLGLTAGRMRIGSGAVPTTSAAALAASALDAGTPVTGFLTGAAGENVDNDAFLTVQTYWTDAAAAALDATLTITVSEAI